MGDLASTIAGRERGFSNEASLAVMTQPHFDRLVILSETLAATAAKIPEKLSACLGATPILEGCIRTFVADFGARAFRRPLEPEEQNRYVQLFAQQVTWDPTGALPQLIQQLLMSPHC